MTTNDKTTAVLDYYRTNKDYYKHADPRNERVTTQLDRLRGANWEYVERFVYRFCEANALTLEQSIEEIDRAHSFWVAANR